jgi:amino acid transporter
MSETSLHRRLGLFQSSVLNMIDMVGIGPFVTLPIVIGYIGGMYLWAWVAGALLSFIDAMVWSELGSRFPKAGGSYHFLKESFGKEKAGNLMSFLYVWQTVIQAPLVAASAAIGFSEYVNYFFPLSDMQQKMIAGSVIIFITFLLYRKIESVGKIGVLLWTGLIITLAWIIVGGISHGNMMAPVRAMGEAFSMHTLLSFAFGQACVKSIYSYLGYYNVCHLGAEIKEPQKNIPRSMFISIMGIAFLYMLMNISVGSVIPWREISDWQSRQVNPYVISIFIERIYGVTAANMVTILILWVALASLFAVMLGYSRVPYAAAADGSFFKIFAKLHPKKEFPYVSLLVIASIAFIFSLTFRLKETISGILAMRIIVQFIGQAVGLMMLRKRESIPGGVYRMPLYPIPVVLAILIWTYVFFSTGLASIGSFAAVLGSGLIIYFMQQRFRKKIKT